MFIFFLVAWGARVTINANQNHIFDHLKSTNLLKNDLLRLSVRVKALQLWNLVFIRLGLSYKTSPIKYWFWNILNSQSLHIIARWAIFIKHKLRFGMVLTFEPVGSTGKNGGPIMSNFWGRFFMFSWAKKF